VCFTSLYENNAAVIDCRYKKEGAARAAPSNLANSRPG